MLLVCVLCAIDIECVAEPVLQMIDALSRVMICLLMKHNISAVDAVESSCVYREYALGN